MSYARNLARLARAGVPVVNSLQDIRDLTIYGSLYPPGVIVRGHTLPNDGGGGYFNIITGQTPGHFVDDDGITVVFTSGDGSAAAVRDFIGTDVYVEWYGANNTGAASISPAIDAAHDYIYTNFGGGSVRLGAGVFAISDTSIFQPGIGLLGSDNATTIIPIAGGTFTSGWLFMFNTEDGDLPINEFGVNDPGIIGQFEVDNSVNNILNCRFAVFHGKYEFRRIVATGLSQLLTRTIADGTVEYSDKITISRIQYRLPQDITTYYAIDLFGLGDGYLIQQVAFAYSYSFDAPTKGLFIDWSRGGTINGLINGHHFFKRCEALEVQGNHIESGSITIEDCNMRVLDTVFWHWRDSYPKLIIAGAGSEQQRHVIGLENVTFQCRFDQTDAVPADIQHDGKTTVHLRNVGRVPTYDYDTGSVAGVFVADRDGAPFAEFNNYSHILSQEGVIDGSLVSGQKTTYPKFCTTLSLTPTPVGAINSIELNNKWTWTLGAGTYYYAMTVLLDPVRLIGHVVSNEVSIATSTEGIQLNVTPGAGNQNVMVRYYRGTSPGSYDAYVDVPHVNLRSLVDSGAHLGNFAWLSRTASPAATVNEFHTIAIDQSQCRSWASSASGEYPTVGTWKNGDEHVLRPYDIDGSSMLTGAIRRTNGSSNTIDVDWRRVYVSTVPL